MSWSQWPVSQAMGAMPAWPGAAPGVPGAGVAAGAAPIVGGIGAHGNPYSPEQWAAMTALQQQNWQQWMQWQQQYQQWQAQYGEQYAKSMAQTGQIQPSYSTISMHPPLPTDTTVAPPPLPTENAPPLPPEEPPKNIPTGILFNANVPPPTSVSNQLTIPPPKVGFQQHNNSYQGGNVNNRFNTKQPPPLLSLNLQKPAYEQKNTPNKNQNFRNDKQEFNNKRPGDFKEHYEDVKKNRWEPLNKNQIQINKTSDILWGNNNFQPPKSNNPEQPKTWNQTTPNTSTVTNPTQTAQGSQRNITNNQQQQWQTNKQTSARPNVEELSEAEKNFDKQFEQWEAQFNKWKEQNAGHPDKQQYKEYEAKWESWRAQLLERREQMRKKRLGILAPQTNSNTKPVSTSTTTNSATPTKSKETQQVIEEVNIKTTETQQSTNSSETDKSKDYSPEDSDLSFIFTQPPKEQRTNIRTRRLSFKQDTDQLTIDTSFLKSSQISAGIPGLDLVKDDANKEIENTEEINKTETSEIDASKQLDLEAISKGLTTILGDEKLLNMLNMVSQNKKIEISTQQTNNNPIVPEDFNNSTQSNESFYQDYNQSTDYNRSFSQNETKNFCQKTDFTKPPPNFNSDFSRPPHFVDNKVPQNLNQSPSNDLNKFNRAPPNNFNDFRGPLNQNFNRPPNDFENQVSEKEFNDKFEKNQEPNRSFVNNQFGPNRNYFGPNRSGPGNQFNSNRSGSSNDQFVGKEPNNQFGQNNFNRDTNNLSNCGGSNNPFGNSNRVVSNDNFDGSNNRFRGPNDQYDGPNNQFSGPNRNDSNNQFKGGPNDPFSAPNNQFIGLNPGTSKDNFPNFDGPSDQFIESNRESTNQFRMPNRGGPNNQFSGPNRGLNNPLSGLNITNDQFGGPNRGPNDQFTGPNRNPNEQFTGPNRNPNEQFGGPIGGLNDQSNRINRGPNSNQFGGQNKSTNDQFSGPFMGNQFGGSNRDLNQFSGANRGPHEQFGQRDMNLSRDMQNNMIDPSNRAERRWSDGNFTSNNNRVSDTHRRGSDLYWDEALILKPFTVIDYEHKSSNTTVNFLEPVQTFDYNHKSKISNNNETNTKIDRPLRDTHENYSKHNRYSDPFSSRKENSYKPSSSSFPKKFEKENSPNYNLSRSSQKNDRFENTNNRMFDYNIRKYDDNKKGSTSNKFILNPNDYEDIEDDPFEDDDFNHEPHEKHTINIQNFNSKLNTTSKTEEKVVTMVEDLLIPPGRNSRPHRIVIILRGPPGSGKTFLAKLIKDKEVEQGGSAPRILSLDDYFMLEQDKEVIEEETGRKTVVKKMVYEYEECMEISYRQSLERAFRKTITDGYFPFIILDCVNDKVKHFSDMWSFAKQNGFQVYICQMELDVSACTKRNVHHRSEVEIERLVAGWESTPAHYLTLDATGLIQSGCIPDVEMEEVEEIIDSEQDDEDNEGHVISKWERMEHSGDKLARLDGINKPLRPKTMEDYLQMDDDSIIKEDRPGVKRVRWADLEERRHQEKIRALGFVVGQTDWNRMMDPTQGSSALTQTKYIERVRRF